MERKAREDPSNLLRGEEKAEPGGSPAHQCWPNGLAIALEPVPGWLGVQVWVFGPLPVVRMLGLHWLVACLAWGEVAQPHHCPMAASWCVEASRGGKADLCTNPICITTLLLGNVGQVTKRGYDEQGIVRGVLDSCEVRRVVVVLRQRPRSRPVICHKFNSHGPSIFFDPDVGCRSLILSSKCGATQVQPGPWPS